MRPMTPAKPRTPTDAPEDVAAPVLLCVAAVPVDVPDDFELAELPAVVPVPVPVPVEDEPEEAAEEGEAPPVVGAFAD